MEQRMKQASTAVMELSAALERYEAAQESVRTLDEYYGSGRWKQDYAADKAGCLPADLKRGILSEDGIWNLLADVRELNNRLKTVSQQ